MLILGIIITTLLSVPVGRLWGDATALIGTKTLLEWKGLVALPDFSLFIKMDLENSLGLAIWPVIFALVFTDMFDSLSTFVGVSEAANLKDQSGEPRNIKQSMIVDSMATIFSGIFGSSPGTSYIESAAGIEQGGRSGLTAARAWPSGYGRSQWLRVQAHPSSARRDRRCGPWPLSRQAGRCR